MIIKYSPDARDRLRKIRQEAGIKITGNITGAAVETAILNRIYPCAS